MDRDSPQPTEIKLHQKSRVLEIAFDDGHAAGTAACLEVIGGPQPDRAAADDDDVMLR